MTIELARLIPTVDDFPQPGVKFRDITPLLADHDAFRESVRLMCKPWRSEGVEMVVAIEARGFMFAAPIALKLGAGFVPVRKAGKLPRPTRSAEYTLEYRTDTLQVHADAIRPGQRVLLVDDVLATGGTAAATVKLMEQLGAEVVGLGFLIELLDLGGRRLLGRHPVQRVLAF